MHRPILVIEDSDEDFDVLQASLRSATAQNPLIRCATGKEVSAYLMKAYELSSSAYPIFVLLDIKIPGGDGRNILKDLRSHPVLGPVPVIMMTTSSQPGDIENCYRWGASGYMVKPVDLERFEAMVEKMAGYWLQCVETVPFPHGRQLQTCK